MSVVIKNRINEYTTQSFISKFGTMYEFSTIFDAFRFMKSLGLKEETYKKYNYISNGYTGSYLIITLDKAEHILPVVDELGALVRFSDYSDAEMFILKSDISKVSNFKIIDERTDYYDFIKLTKQADLKKNDLINWRKCMFESTSSPLDLMGLLEMKIER